MYKDKAGGPAPTSIQEANNWWKNALLLLYQAIFNALTSFNCLDSENFAHNQAASC